MPDVARLHTAYVWVPGGYGDQTNGLCINQTHGPHHWALQMTPVGQIDIHLQHAFWGVSGGSFGSHAVPSVSIQRQLWWNSGAGSLVRWAGQGGSRANVANQSGPGGVRQPRWATAGRSRGKGLGARRFPALCGGRRQHRFGPMSYVLAASLVCIGHPLRVWAIERSPPRGVCDAPHPQRGLVPSRHQGEPAGEAGRRTSLRPEIHYSSAAV